MLERPGTLGRAGLSSLPRARLGDGRDLCEPELRGTKSEMADGWRTVGAPRPPDPVALGKLANMPLVNLQPLSRLGFASHDLFATRGHELGKLANKPGHFPRHCISSFRPYRVVAVWRSDSAAHSNHLR